MSGVASSAIIGDGVELGERVTVGPMAVVLGPARIGDDCWIGPACVIGTPPEISGGSHNLAWDGELAHRGVRIGARTVIREFSTIHQGSRRATTIGDDSVLLNHVYVAHDCLIDDGVTLSGGVSLGGHVLVGSNANVGMNVVVHQRRVVGPGVMVGMGSVVSRDIPPYAKAFGNPARLQGVNTVGMGRVGIDEDSIELLDEAYALRQVPTEIPEQLRGAFMWWHAAEPARPFAKSTDG